MAGFEIRLVFTLPRRQYTAVQKMRTPLKLLSLHYNLDLTNPPLQETQCCSLLEEQSRFSKVFQKGEKLFLDF